MEHKRDVNPAPLAGTLEEPPAGAVTRAAADGPGTGASSSFLEDQTGTLSPIAGELAAVAGNLTSGDGHGETGTLSPIAGELAKIAGDLTAANGQGDKSSIPNDNAGEGSGGSTFVPSPQMGGIEILVAMAEKGEIDPKNIDIIDVTDRFLKAIAAAPKENLRQSGKILFQASVLLRMKAEALLVEKIEDLDFTGDDFVEFDEDGSPIIYDSNQRLIARQITLADLERALVRRTKTRQLRQRRVTLEQLIEALREAEQLERMRLERRPKAVIDLEGHADMRDMDDILELAHDEDIEDVIERVERILSEYFEDNQILPLVALIKQLGGRGDWVDAFLAVLFLSNAGKVQLEQEQFWGPLYVAKANDLPDTA